MRLLPDRGRPGSQVSARRPPGRRARAPCPARRRRSAAPGAAAAARCSRRTTRLPPVGSWVTVIVTRVPPSSVSASSIRVVHVSGVSTQPGRDQPPRRPLEDLALRAPRRRAAPSSRPGAQTNVVPFPGIRCRRRPRRRRRRPRSRARARPARATPRRATGAPRGRRCRSRWSLSGRPRRPRTPPGSRPAAAGRSCAPADGRRCPGRSCGRRAAASPATMRRSSASLGVGGADVDDDPGVRQVGRRTPRRRNSYSEPVLKSGLGGARVQRRPAGSCAPRGWARRRRCAAARARPRRSVPSSDSSAATADGAGTIALGEHLRADLGALLGHHRVEAGDAVHEALAVLVPDGRPRDVGAAPLLADEVAVGDQAVDRAAQRDPADAVLGAQHRLGREQRLLGQRGHPAAEVLADREVLRSGYGAHHAAKVLDRRDVWSSCRMRRPSLGRSERRADTARTRRNVMTS